MSELTARPIDWTKVLTDESRLTDVIATDALVRKFGLSRASVRKALFRLEKRNLVSRITKGVYVNRLVRDYSPQDFVAILKPDSYVSLESALNHWGLSTQSPVALTCVTTAKPNEYRTTIFSIVFRKISKRLFGGFVEKQTRYAKYRIAEPEKALLDWIYLSLQLGLKPALDEIDFKRSDKQKLVEYARKFPGSVRRVLADSFAFEHFAA
jgi:predicted transcriptional regulator of viral defense system